MARGSNVRAKKRANALVDEIVEQAAQEVETSRIALKQDHELFVIDTTTDTDVASSKTTPNKKKVKKPQVSEKDQAKIKQLMKTHDAQQLQKMAEAGGQLNKHKKKRTADFDLWGNDDNEATKKKKKSTNDSGIGMSLAGTAPAFDVTVAKRAPSLMQADESVAVDVARAGQSYHPDVNQHQDVIGEALALELRRKEAQDYNKKPISAGMSDETKAILILQDDSSDDESDDDSETESTVFAPRRKKEKLTRAQRNRQKRIRAQEVIQKEKKCAKKLLNSVSELKFFSKQLQHKQEANKARKEFVAQLKEENKRTLGKEVIQHFAKANPIRAPTIPVALTEELSGRLRTIKPKGSLVTDRIYSLVDRNMANRKQVTKKHVVQGKKRKVRGKDKDYLLEG